MNWCQVIYLKCVVFPCRRWSGWSERQHERQRRRDSGVEWKRLSGDWSKHLGTDPWAASTDSFQGSILQTWVFTTLTFTIEYYIAIIKDSLIFCCLKLNVDLCVHDCSPSGAPCLRRGTIKTLAAFCTHFLNRLEKPLLHLVYGYNSPIQFSNQWSWSLYIPLVRWKFNAVIIRKNVSS